MSEANPPPATERSLARRPLILAACMAASFMAAIEATIIATAMPSIADALGGFGLYSWVFSAYMLAQAATIPLYGRLADIHGRRKVFFVGAGLFLIGSTLCGFSHTMPQLVLFRTIQGLGAGGVQPIANTIVGDIYTPVERARVQGMLSGVFGVSAVIGPSVGAILVQYGAWPLVFWVNLPIGAAAIGMIALFLPEQAQTSRHLIDTLGSLLLLLAIGALMLLLVQGGALDRWTQAAAVAVFLLAGGFLLLHERRAPEPMLPLELWRNGVIASSSVGSLLTGTLMMGVIAYLPTYVQGVMGRGADASAVVLAAMSVIWVLGSTTAGLCLPHASYRRIAVFGALALIAGAAMLIALTPARGLNWAAAGAILVGVGMGFCNTTFLIAAQTSVGWRQRGAATSSIMFLRFLGQSLGAALFGAVLDASLGAGTETTLVLDRLLDPPRRRMLPADQLRHLVEGVASAMRHAYLLTGLLAVLSLLLALTYPARLGAGGRSRPR